MPNEGTTTIRLIGKDGFHKDMPVDIHFASHEISIPVLDRVEAWYERGGPPPKGDIKTRRFVRDPWQLFIFHEH